MNAPDPQAAAMDPRDDLPLVLVVDDSLTVRRVTQRLLTREGYRVVLSPTGLGLGVTVFASVKLAHHGDAIVERFREEILLLDAVQECFSVAGDADYMLRVVVPDLPALSEFVMRKLMRVPGVDNVRSNIVLTALKRDGALPLSHLGG